jgi:cell wall-associated NlpC family hydrolase
MTDTRTSSARRSLGFGRRAAVALTLGAGMALTPLPALASGGTTAPPATAAPAPAATAAAQVAVDTALAQVGDPYVWAGAGPNSFDCSGLTQYAYRAAGISLPHSSRMQSGIGTPVSYSNLQPGDLVFFYSPVSHVGMYIGNGQIVHAPYSGSTVQVVELAYMPDFAGARRLA